MIPSARSGEPYFRCSPRVSRRSRFIQSVCTTAELESLWDSLERMKDLLAWHKLR